MIDWQKKANEIENKDVREYLQTLIRLEQDESFENELSNFSDFQDWVNNTLIHFIETYGRWNIDAIKYLVEYLNADVNSRKDGSSDSGYTPLHFACKKEDKIIRNKQLIKYLVSKGADVNSLSDNGSTPLDFFLRMSKGLDRETELKKVKSFLERNGAKYSFNLN